MNAETTTPRAPNGERLGLLTTEEGDTVDVRSYCEAAITSDGVRVPMLVNVDGVFIPVGSIPRIPNELDITSQPIPLQYKRYYPREVAVTIDFGVPYSVLVEDGVLIPY